MPLRDSLPICFATAAILCLASPPIVLAQSTHDAYSSVLDLDSVDIAGIRNISELLASRFPGVTVMPSSGLAGAGSIVRIRGFAHGLLRADPLLIVDGMRAGARPETADQLSELDDVDVESVERIEVLPGAVAVMRYGPDAAHGAIVVVTRSARRGVTKWRGFAGAGMSPEVTGFPLNYGQVGYSGGLRVTNCSLAAQAEGSCVAVPDSMLAFSPIEATSPFSDGQSREAGLSLASSAGPVTFYAAASTDRVNGQEEVNYSVLEHVRLNADAYLHPSLTVGVRTAYLDREVRLPPNYTSIFSTVGNALLGAAHDDSLRGYRFALPDDLNQIDLRHSVQRRLGSVNVGWEPLSWLDMALLAGADLREAHGYDNFPGLGGVARERTGIAAHDTYTLMARAAASRNLSANWALDLSLGAERVRMTVEEGESFTVGGTTGSASRLWLRERWTGIVTDSRFRWRDQVWIDAALRRDREEFSDPAHSWRAGVTWALDRAAFFRRSPVPGIDALSLHAAFAQTVRPIGLLNLVDLRLGFPVGPPGTSPPNLEPIGPDRSTEWEAGLMSRHFGDRMRTRLSYHATQTRTGLTGGAGSPFVRNATIRERALSVMIDAFVVRSPVVEWSVGIAATTLRNAVASFTQGAFIPISLVQQHRQDHPLGGYWQRPILDYEDLDGSGTISIVNCPGGPVVDGGPACELIVGDESVYLGSPVPARSLSLSSTLMLGGTARLSATLDHSGRQYLFNSGEATRCRLVETCRGLNDPNTPLPEQARAQAVLLGTFAGFIENASFTRLQEVTLTLFAPQRSGLAGLSSARVSLSGRNLATWTDYTGLDPTLSNRGSAPFVRSGSFAYPRPRIFTLRLDLER